MRTKALVSALVLFGSTAAIAQVAGTQDAPLTNNSTEAPEGWEETTPPPAPDGTGDTTTTTEDPLGAPDAGDTTPPPTDPTAPPPPAPQG